MTHKTDLPMRTCIACRSKKQKSELVRISFFNNEIILDKRKNLPGRGCYICPDLQCLDLVIKSNKLQRNLRQSINPEQSKKLYEEIRLFLTNSKSFQ